VDADLDIAAGKKGCQFSGEHLGVTARNDDIGIIFRIPVADTLLKFVYLLGFINENTIMLSMNEAFLNPCVQIIFGFDILKGLLLFVNEDDVYIRFIFMSLDEVLKDIAFAYTAGAYQSDDVAFPYPGINDIGVMFSSQYFHGIPVLSNAKIVKFYFL
jgi:hypothetical protein